VFIVATVLSLIPTALLAAAWRKYFLGARDIPIPRWRLYSGGIALLLASLTTAWELVFLVFWFHGAGSFRGVSLPPVIWKVAGGIAVWMFFASILLSFLGKGRWRFFISVWAVAVCFVVPLIFALELITSRSW